MRVLVTGGSGFIGSHLVNKLVERNIKVRIYDMVVPEQSHKGVEFYKASLLDFDSMLMVMTGIDAVFHLGAVANVNDVYDEPHYSEAVNVRGTINLLEAVRRSKNIKRVIYGSTIWVYSDTEGELLTEETPLSPPSHMYTATKITSEYYCQCYAKLYNLPVTILRYGIPYGPRARGAVVTAIFVDKALKGEPITIAGDGSQYRKFVYVEDLAEGNVLALQSIAANKIYNLEGSEKITIKQIAETVKKIIGDVKIVHTEARPRDFKGKEISNERALKELGWRPKVSFEDGMKKYIDWYKEKKKEEEEALARIDKRLLAIK